MNKAARYFSQQYPMCQLIQLQVLLRQLVIVQYCLILGIFSHHTGAWLRLHKNRNGPKYSQARQSFHPIQTERDMDARVFLAGKKITQQIR